MRLHQNKNLSRTRLALYLLIPFLSVQAVRAQGHIATWGWDEYGQVSDAPLGDDFIRVAGGAWHSIALRADGSLVAWGRDDSGIVSNLPAGVGFTQIASGRGHGLALKSDGSIAAWGADWSGQVSNAPAGLGFLHVAGGANHSLAVRSNGSIVAWGSDSDGQVSGAPTGGGFVQVAGGDRHSTALLADGSLVAWGRDFNGQVSNVPTGTGFIQISANSYYTLALRTDGSIEAWGGAWGGVVANAPTEAGFVQISVGGQHALALRADGTFVTWGSGSFGLMANAPGGKGYLQVAGAADNHSIVLRANVTGAAFCAGDGTGTVCPCLANGLAGEGCLNTTGLHGATLLGLGETFLSEDTFRLLVVGVPAQKAGLILQGASQVNAGLGVLAGDGLLCVSGQTVRSQVQVTSTGPASFASFLHFRGAPFGASAHGAGVPTNYQFWYRDPANTCSGAGFNFSNGWTTTWLP